MRNLFLFRVLERWHRLRRTKTRCAKKLSGRGLELGALHTPFPLAGAEVTYVDRMSREQLRHHYPELAGRPLVPIDRIDDAERLASFGDASHDFVVASHVLEHCEDAIGSFENWLRVVRPGGHLLVVVPNKERTFDRTRPVTPLAHFETDLGRAQVSRAQHYLEWAEQVEGKEGGSAHETARRLQEVGYSIHFHVWDFASFEQFVRLVARRTDWPFDTLRLVNLGSEFLLLAQRRTS